MFNYIQVVETIAGMQDKFLEVFSQVFKKYRISQ